MNIILMADPRKFDLLVNFCIAYKQILKKHQLSSQFNLSRQIREACDLAVDTLPSDRYVQVEQLASKANYGEIDAVIYLRDPQVDNWEAFDRLSRACDANSIPYATNLASAELFVLALDRGDLDWRELIRNS